MKDTTRRDKTIGAVVVGTIAGSLVFLFLGPVALLIISLFILYAVIKNAKKQ